jgi:ligand-binding sensor domain-containing protein/signal transduction histidine kinase/DNA-binding response OmpR family regulator
MDHPNIAGPPPGKQARDYPKDFSYFSSTVKKRLYLFLILLILVCDFGEICAQTEQYKFSHVNVNQGLSHNQIKCFLKDSRGFVWFGTLSGLNRYDGYTIKVFRNTAGDTTSIRNSDINKMFEDPDGRIWISTWTGIDVYDPATETFYHDPTVYLERFGIPAGTINDIRKDRQGNFWFVHNTLGLFKFQPATQTLTPLFHKEADTTSIATNHIASLTDDAVGNLWLVHKNGVVEKADIKTGTVTWRSAALRNLLKSEDQKYVITVDNDGDAWIFMSDSNRGIFQFSNGGKTFVHIDDRSSPLRLKTSIVRGIVQDNKGVIWVATDHGGINLIHKKEQQVTYLFNDPSDEKSLSQNSINTMYKDYEGIIWIGTFKQGVDYYHENIIRFNLYRHAPGTTGLPFDDINAFVSDEKGNLWIGTNGGGLIFFDRERNKFTQYLHNPSNPQSISNNVIVSLRMGHDKKLWIGTYFGGLNMFDGVKFTRYKHDPANPSSLADDNVWEILEDRQHQLWIGTLNQGLERFDQQTRQFHHYPIGENSVHSTYVPSLMEDVEGNLWVGTGYGIDLMEKSTGKIIHYLNDPKDPRSLSNNSVLFLLQDSRGLVWAGTHGGLNVFDARTKTFKHFTEEDGLPHNSILTLVEDNQRNLWVSTPHGLSNVIIDYDSATQAVKISCKNYDESDGLQGRQFNDNAVGETPRGELVFGGSNGFNLFRPDDIGVNKNIPKVILTDLQIFNKSVKIGETLHKQVILERSIGETETITLPHNDNVFSLEFVALNYFHPQKSQYKYKLEGFSKDWLTTDGTQRKVTYTNLDPGDYTFLVTASNNEGVWNEKAARLKIVILPPFWKTKTAFVLYVFIILGALLLSRQLILERERMKYRIEKERQEAQQLHELDMMKIKFFTNVSHEFRTPLTLILTPLERLLKVTKDDDQRGQFQLIHRNARRLLNLVNQLLDFRRMEVQEVKLNSSEGDIVAFVKEATLSFSDLSEKKNIGLAFHTAVPSLETAFDKDKLEKILFNLLSNAFKFTPEGGKVDVAMALRVEEDEKWMEIKVKDTGIGVPAEKHEKIFERFFQNDLPRTMVNQGSGIGLSITREFVKAHNGSITVESAPNEGSCFTVRIPVVEISTESIPDTLPQWEETTLTQPVAAWTAPESHSPQLKKPVLLLVEDNEDFRFYLKDNLKGQYQILEARNGSEGWEKVVQHLPDLVVSDVMMPVMNGIELCKKIKNDPSVSHTPVVLLTARTDEEQKMEGFEIGADDYVTKPFNFEILQSRIRNLIHQREMFHKEFRKQIEVRATDINITSLDEKLIKNAIKAVEDQLENPDFSVEDLSRELGMSRVHLYKKLLALTGKAPLEFIRTIRLQRSAQLLEKSQLTISEVAYKVGFNSPKYFAKYFKDEFGMLPSAYVAIKKNGGAPAAG